MLQNIEIRRGDDRDITLYLDGDYSSDVFSFVVKSDKTLTTARQIEKDSSDSAELERSYNSTSGKTTITIHILQADTQGLSTLDYYYDLFNDTDNETVYHGKFFILADVQTPTDNGSAPVGINRYGTTAQRPTLDSSAEYIGFSYFDTDLGSQIVWSGTAWVVLAGGTNNFLGSFTTAQIEAEGTVGLTAGDWYFNTDLDSPFFWNGSAFV